MPENIHPDISVLIIAYNNGPYILQCLESIVRQKYAPTFEIVIAEDCSTDDTRMQIQNWRKKHVNNGVSVKLLFNDKNVGVTRNFAMGILHCQGKFVVPIAGDDCFVNEFVLCHLYDYISSNEEVVVYSTNSIQIFEDSKRLILGIQRGEVLKLTTKDLLYHNPVGGAIIFRNIIRNFPDLYLESEAEDRQMWYLLSEHGEIHVNPLFTGKLYRRHAGSITMKDRRSREEKIKLRIKDNKKWRCQLHWISEEDFVSAQKFHLKKLLKEQLKSFKLISALKTFKTLNHYS